MGHYYDIKADPPVKGLPEFVKSWHHEEALRAIIERHDIAKRGVYDVDGESDMPSFRVTIEPIPKSGWGSR